MAAPAPHLRPVGFERRVVDSCRGILDDIPECAEAEMKCQFFGGVPHLVIVFQGPHPTDKPACAVRLNTVSLSNPLAEGQPLEGDRLRRAVRNAVEQYMHRHGVRVPTAQFETPTIH